VCFPQASSSCGCGGNAEWSYSLSSVVVDLVVSAFPSGVADFNAVRRGGHGAVWTSGRYCFDSELRFVGYVDGGVI